MKVLAFDTSLRAFGWCFVDFAAVRLGEPLVPYMFPSDGGVLITDEDADVSARLAWAAGIIRRKVDSYAPDVVAVEALAYLPGKIRWSTLTALARARQVVDDAATFHRVGALAPPVVEVSAGSVGRFALGRKGKGDKAERIASLRERFPPFDRGCALATGLASTLDTGSKGVGFTELRQGFYDDLRPCRATMLEHVADAFAVACVAAGRSES